MPLPFQYQSEKNDSGLTGFAGLSLYLELAVHIGLIEYINQTIKTKIRGWTDAEMILSLVFAYSSAKCNFTKGIKIL